MGQTPEEQEHAAPRDRDALLARIRRSRAALEATLQPLSPARMTTPDPEGGWSVKDHLAHLTAWEQGIVALLQHRPRWAAMGLEEGASAAGEDAINAIIQAAASARPLPETLAAFHGSYRQLLATLDRLSDADLLRPYSYFQPEEPGEDDGRPIIGWVIANTYDHYDEHRGWIAALIDRIGAKQ